MRRVLVAALVTAVGSFGQAAWAQQPPAAPDSAKPGAAGPLTLQGPDGRPGGGRGAGPRAGATGGRPSLTAMRAAQAPSIDGRLDDTIWLNAPVINTFVQEEPIEGAAATEQTEVRVAYDSEKLYFGIYAHYADVGLRRVNRSDRDKLDNDDTVTVTLEPFLDYLRGYSFAVNGYGVQNDSMIVVQNAQSSAGRRPQLQRAVRFRRAADRRRLDGRNRHSDPQPPVSRAEGGRSAPLGTSGPACRQKQGRVRRLVAHLT